MGPNRSYISFMLRLSKKADYGLIALIHLASKGSGRSASAKEMADACNLPLPLLAKVLQKLTRQGFLAAVHGTNGGYRLARDAGGISALEVIRAIDGPVFLTSCSSGETDCHRTSHGGRQGLQKSSTIHIPPDSFVGSPRLDVRTHGIFPLWIPSQVSSEQILCTPTPRCRLPGRE